MKAVTEVVFFNTPDDEECNTSGRRRNDPIMFGKGENP
jgi:hypothetical protein